MLPYEFHSERSARNNIHPGNLNINVNACTHVAGQREYDSDRKSRKDTAKVQANISQLNQHKSVNGKAGLKRTNTQKILSPKSKVHRNFGQREK